MKNYKNYILPIILIGFFFLNSCSNKNKYPQKEILIYCGNTMIQPMNEIAEIIEKKENCKILFVKDGSGNLLNSIIINQCGDLFLPGSDYYIRKAKEQELVIEDVFVGKNKAVITIQKGNPKNITADLDNFADTKYYVVMGNPDSCSIGKESKQIFTKKGIFKNVLSNIKALTIDSKDLVNAIKNKQADMAINWYANSYWEENKTFIDILPIDERYTKPKKLVLGLLKTSRHPDIAKSFMKLASSKDGIKIFKKYGLYLD